MQWIKLLFPVLGAALTGCAPAVVVRPLYDSEDKAPVDQRVEGEWVTPDVSSSGPQDKLFFRWTAGSYDQSAGYSVTLRRLSSDRDEVKEDTATLYHLRLLPIGGKLFFEAEYRSEKVGPREIALDDLSPGVIPAQVVGRLWIQQDFLRIAFLDSDWVRKNMPKSFWVRKYGGDEQIAAITAPADEVRALLIREADNPTAFALVLHFCRPGAPCAARAVEDELSRQPKDADTIREAAGLYLRQGNYPRAIELRRRLVELSPNDPNARQELGTALLFDRDFEDARREFLAAQQSSLPSVGNTPFSWEVSWSYFLEGKYEQAAKASADHLVLTYPYPEIILLDYVSLVRLGRTEEAQALLDKNVASFQGSWDNQFLLLEFQQRVLGDAPAPPAPAAAREFAYRRSFFLAMRLALQGDKEKAAAAFQQVINAAGHDDLLYLASQIELERLGQPAPRSAPPATSPSSPSPANRSSIVH